MFDADRPPLIMPETPCASCLFIKECAIGKAVTALTVLADTTTQPSIDLHSETIDDLLALENAIRRGQLYGLNPTGLITDRPYSIVSTIINIATDCSGANPKCNFDPQLSNADSLLHYAMEILSEDRQIKYHVACMRYSRVLALRRKGITDQEERDKISEEIRRLTGKSPKAVLDSAKSDAA